LNPPENHRFVTRITERSETSQLIERCGFRANPQAARALTMSGGVFISYRREDSRGVAGRIYDRLSDRLGSENVFFDVDNIAPGLDFVDVLTERVSVCDALVAVIGKDWLASADKTGRRRLDNSEDFVRVEIEAALKRGVRVIPVLVEDAAMPQADELPESLRKLARRQGVVIDHARFNSDVERLIRVLSEIEEQVYRVNLRAPSAAPQSHSLAVEQAPAKLIEAAPARDAGEASRAEATVRRRIAPLAVALAGVAAVLMFGAVALRGWSVDSARSTKALFEPVPGGSSPTSPPLVTADAAQVQALLPTLSPPPAVPSSASDSAANAAPRNNAAPLNAPVGLVDSVPKVVSKADLAHEIEQQKAALANGSQDMNRLTQEANAAVQDIKTDAEPLASTKFANAAAPSGLTRFRMTDCGSIADTKTGVEWYVGPDKDIPWEDANSWVRGLSACGKHWTMPSADEARALFDKALKAGSGYYSGGRNWPAHIDPIFSGIGGGSWVWTKGSAAAGNGPAFNLNQDVPVEIPASNSALAVRVFAVAKPN
jgi:TIR domain